MHQDLFEGDRFTVRRVSIPQPGGGTATKDVIIHPAAVAILPILDDGRLVLIRNHRFTIDRPLLEIPAGKVDDGEVPEAAARRECCEETGYEPAVLTPLCRFYPSPGILSEEMHVYVGTALAEREQSLMDNERIEVEIMTWAEVFALLDRGAIEDAKTIVAILYYARQQPLGADA